MESSQTAITALTIIIPTTSALQHLLVLRKRWRSSTTQRELTLVLELEKRTMGSFFTVLSLHTLQETVVKETTPVVLKLESTTRTLTHCPQMNWTLVLMWGQRTSRAWTKIPPHSETIQILTQTVRPWPGHVPCLNRQRDWEMGKEQDNRLLTLLMRARGQKVRNKGDQAPAQHLFSTDPTP